jgi:hypothetical protein
LPVHSPGEPCIGRVSFQNIFWQPVHLCKPVIVDGIIYDLSITFRVYKPARWSWLCTALSRNR